MISCLMDCKPPLVTLTAVCPSRVTAKRHG